MYLAELPNMLQYPPSASKMTKLNTIFRKIEIKTKQIKISKKNLEKEKTNKIRYSENNKLKKIQKSNKKNCHVWSCFPLKKIVVC